jgi:hypothetical protein
MIIALARSDLKKVSVVYRKCGGNTKCFRAVSLIFSVKLLVRQSRFLKIRKTINAEIAITEPKTKISVNPRSSKTNKCINLVFHLRNHFG